MTLEFFLENLSREIRRVQRMPWPAFAVFQVPIAQNNQYAKVYVEVTYSATAHSPLQTLKPKLWTSVLTSEQQEA